MHFPIRPHAQPSHAPDALCLPLPARWGCRAGADEVYGAEISAHMCDVGKEATIMNGFLRRITMLDRYLSGRPENVVKRG